MSAPRTSRRIALARAEIRAAVSCGWDSDDRDATYVELTWLVADAKAHMRFMDDVRRRNRRTRGAQGGTDG